MGFGADVYEAYESEIISGSMTLDEAVEAFIDPGWDEVDEASDDLQDFHERDVDDNDDDDMDDRGSGSFVGGGGVFGRRDGGFRGGGVVGRHGDHGRFRGGLHGGGGFYGGGGVVGATVLSHGSAGDAAMVSRKAHSAARIRSRSPKKSGHAVAQSVADSGRDYELCSSRLPFIGDVVVPKCMASLEYVVVDVQPSGKMFKLCRPDGTITEKFRPRRLYFYADKAPEDVYITVKKVHVFAKRGLCAWAINILEADAVVVAHGPVIHDVKGGPFLPMRPSGMVKLEFLRRKYCGEAEWVTPEDSASNFAQASPSPCSQQDDASMVSASGISSQSTLSSLLSAGSGGRRCFLVGALFRKVSGDFIEAGKMVVGSEVLGSNGQQLTVVSVETTPSQHQDLIKIEAGDGIAETAGLKVTATHRVMVQRGHSGQTMPASHLRTGDLVYCSQGKVLPIINIFRSTEQESVVRVAFQPDEPVEAFYPPQPAILSKGYGHAKTTRRSMCKKRMDLFSIPETDDGFSS